MKEKIIKIAIVFVILVTILFLAINAFRTNELDDRSKNNERPLAVSTQKSKKAPNDFILGQSTLATKTVDGEIPVIEKTDYRILGHENIPLNLRKKTMLGRIENGIKSMNIVEYKVYHDGEILTMEKAYERLIGSLSFLEGKFPIWGVEIDSFFVFSGRTGTDSKLVFKYGYAVKKENGRIYMWFSPQSEK